MHNVCPESSVINFSYGQIVDPGSSCFIAIGLARKDYPKNRHPGWNKGSIAYHADDGKVTEVNMICDDQSYVYNIPRLSIEYVNTIRSFERYLLEVE